MHRFNTYIKNIFRKAGQKRSALLRISPYYDQGKKVLLYKSMIKSEFNYCPLVWMFCSKQSNDLYNSVHERGLRVSLRPLSRTLLDKSFDCLEQNIQTNGN